MVKHTVSFPVHFTNNTNTNKLDLVLFTNNVKGHTNEVKRKKHYREMQKTKSHIYFTQETHSTQQTNRIWKSQWGQGKTFFANAGTTKKGCRIMFGNNFDPEVLDQKMDHKEGRFAWVKIKYNNQKFQLVNV